MNAVHFSDRLDCPFDRRVGIFWKRICRSARNVGDRKFVTDGSPSIGNFCYLRYFEKKSYPVDMTCDINKDRKFTIGNFIYHLGAVFEGSRSHLGAVVGDNISSLHFSKRTSVSRQGDAFFYFEENGKRSFRIWGRGWNAVFRPASMEREKVSNAPPLIFMARPAWFEPAVYGFQDGNPKFPNLVIIV